MANEKISALTNGNPAQVGDEIPINRGGANFSITPASINALSTAAGIFHLHTVIPSAQVKTLGSVPFVLVPGVAGKIILPFTNLVFRFLNATTPYTLGTATDGRALYDEGVSPIGSDDPLATTITLSGFFDSTTAGSFLCFPGPNAAASSGPDSDFLLGKSAILTLTDVSLAPADITGGDGDLLVDFWYVLTDATA